MISISKKKRKLRVSITMYNARYLGYSCRDIVENGMDVFIKITEKKRKCNSCPCFWHGDVGNIWIHSAGALVQILL